MELPQQDNQSTTSLQSSTTTLYTPNSPPTRSPPQKDYAAALATLQGRYGTSGYVPNPKSQPSQKLPTPSQGSPLARSQSEETHSSSSSTSEASSSTTVEQRSKKSKPSSLLKMFFKSTFFTHFGQIVSDTHLTGKDKDKDKES